MKAILLHNWKAKIASLLLAVAIWFLIRLTIRQSAPPEIPIPGTGSGSPAPIEPGTPIPGTPVGSIFPPAMEEVVVAAYAGFYRLHWVEAGDFAASLVEFPAKALLG